MEAAGLISSQFSPLSYNNLMDVDRADAILWSREGRQAFFDEVGALICAHDLEDHVGLGLLHSHNEVAAGHWMAERFEADTYESGALVMAHVEQGGSDHVPVALQVSEEGLIPMEHSSVDLARANYSALRAAGGEFVRSFCEVVSRHGFEDVVGLAVLRAEVLGPKEGEVYLECIDCDRVANVLRIHPDVPEPGTQHIQTSWKFSKASDESETECLTKCPAESYTYCAEPTERDGRHKKETGERHKGSGTHYPPK